MTSEELQTLLDRLIAPQVPYDPEVDALEYWEGLCRSAAAELIASRTKLAAADGLAEALMPFSEAADECDDYEHDDQQQAPVDAGQCRAAREALTAWEAAK